jgi:hypothetical protein
MIIEDSKNIALHKLCNCMLLGCHTLQNMKNSLALYNSPFVMAYRTIGFSFLEHDTHNVLDLDKFVLKALTVITDHLTKSMESVLSDPSILQLSDCFWSSVSFAFHLFEIRKSTSACILYNIAKREHTNDDRSIWTYRNPKCASFSFFFTQFS